MWISLCGVSIFYVYEKLRKQKTRPKRRSSLSNPAEIAELGEQIDDEKECVDGSEALSGGRNWKEDKRDCRRSKEVITTALRFDGFPRVHATL